MKSLMPPPCDRTELPDHVMRVWLLVSHHLPCLHSTSSSTAFRFHCFRSVPYHGPLTPHLKLCCWRYTDRSFSLLRAVKQQHTRHLASRALAQSLSLTLNSLLSIVQLPFISWLYCSTLSPHLCTRRCLSFC